MLSQIDLESNEQDGYSYGRTDDLTKFSYSRMVTLPLLTAPLLRYTNQRYPASKRKVTLWVRECLHYFLGGRPRFRFSEVVTADAAWLACSTWLGSTPSAPHYGQIQVPSGTSRISLSMHSICQPVPHASHSSMVSFGSVKWQISHARLASGLASW
jgi:hypothetical protein